MRRTNRIVVGLVMLTALYGQVAGVCSQGHSGEGKGDRMQVEQEAFRRAEAVLAHHEATLLGLPGVVGVGVGLTEAGDKPAIHVYANTKATGAPGSTPIPTQIHNVPIRIIETDDIRAR